MGRISIAVVFSCVAYIGISCNPPVGHNGSQGKGSQKPSRRDSVSVIPNEFIFSFSSAFSDSIKAYCQRNKISKYEEKQAAFKETIRKRFDHLWKVIDSSYKILSTTNYTVVVRFEKNKKLNAKDLTSSEFKDVRNNFVIFLELPRCKNGAQPLSGEQFPEGVKRVSNSSKPNGVYNAAWILDSGVDPSHEDLNVDPVFSRSFISEPLDDVIGHGTHVAGIIAAKANGVGVIGVAPNAPIRALKVVNSSSRIDASGYLSALQFVLDNSTAGEVMNMSLQWHSTIPGEESLIQDIASNGVFVTIAAGNYSEDVDANDVYPAKINGNRIYTVSAMDVSDNFAGNFSDFGGSVDYCAPGVDILSTAPGNNYCMMDGTSMAAPHVAGLLLLKSLHSDGTVKGDPDGTPDPIAHE